MSPQSAMKLANRRLAGRIPQPDQRIADNILSRLNLVRTVHVSFQTNAQSAINCSDKEPLLGP